MNIHVPALCFTAPITHGSNSLPWYPSPPYTFPCQEMFSACNQKWLQSCHIQITRRVSIHSQFISLSRISLPLPFSLTLSTSLSLFLLISMKFVYRLIDLLWLLKFIFICVSSYLKYFSFWNLSNFVECKCTPGRNQVLQLYFLYVLKIFVVCYLKYFMQKALKL